MILVEVLRGEKVESVHHGQICIVDNHGKIIYENGNSEKAIFPRSAIKAFQAIPLIESGAADYFKLTGAEIALAVSSHGGEIQHVEAATSMLQKAGRDGQCLECGAHQPMFQKAALALAGKGEQPSALHNNCSGKHSGFICLAVHEKIDPKGYTHKDHALQKRITQSVAKITEVDLSRQSPGVDGCSIPAFAMPLKNIAHGFAKFAQQGGAASIIREAVFDNPFYVAGSDRFCTNAMQILKRRAFVKTGAEGVFCMALPELAIGIALKCEDGATRAAEVMAAGVLQKLLSLSDVEQTAMQKLSSPILHNWEGIEVGSLRFVG